MVTGSYFRQIAFPDSEPWRLVLKQNRRQTGFNVDQIKLLLRTTVIRNSVLMSLIFILSVIIHARIAFIQFSMAAIDSSSVAVHPGLKDRYSCVSSAYACTQERYFSMILKIILENKVNNNGPRYEP